MIVFRGVFFSSCRFIRDIFSTSNKFFRFLATSGAPEKEVLLDENDELWVEFRHEHIAIVTQ